MAKNKRNKDEKYGYKTKTHSCAANPAAGVLSLFSGDAGGWAAEGEHPADRGAAHAAWERGDQDTALRDWVWDQQVGIYSLNL